ncbi:hypothetical protein AMTR_s00022p00215370 [Amborella trichopoda]|uniref:Uncharacterized protein n=1 Tax=Amborella trichopoda TaxID=13333 RepID=W1PNT4_AMBTC|nr:hypothetical protein AMTR_s00022p00215370 [Amborella trichopoda]
MGKHESHLAHGHHKTRFTQVSSFGGCQTPQETLDPQDGWPLQGPSKPSFALVFRPHWVLTSTEALAFLKRLELFDSCCVTHSKLLGIHSMSSNVPPNRLLAPTLNICLTIDWHLLATFRSHLVTYGRRLMHRLILSPRR